MHLPPTRCGKCTGQWVQSVALGPVHSAQVPAQALHVEPFAKVAVGHALMHPPSTRKGAKPARHRRECRDGWVTLVEGLGREHAVAARAICCARATAAGALRIASLAGIGGVGEARASA